MPRYLSKSRFKSALECPTKLDYVGKSDYVDTKKTNDFLKALAEGGFQVGELAKLHYPEGIEVTERDQSSQIAQTNALLEQENVDIFEGTIQYGDWVARVDVLSKRGNQVSLIEVKSKSFDSQEGLAEDQWRGALTKGKSGPKPIKADILPYLQDVAFQTMLFQQAHPSLTVIPFLMIPDKAEIATVDGLNQKFKIVSEGRDDKKRTSAVVVPGTTLESLGKPLLKLINVKDFVQDILNGEIKFPGGVDFFKTKAAEWARAYAGSERIVPVLGKHCRSCEFFTLTPDDQHKSGFHQCWSEKEKISFEQIEQKSPITRLYHPVKGQIAKLIESHGLWMDTLKDKDLPGEIEAKGMSRGYRQNLQVFGKWDESHPFEFDRKRWREHAATFKYPLHFIDFEGCRPALPFVAGKRPYTQIGFQFSHHTVAQDGVVKHVNEFIDLTPGQDPSIAFVRSLKSALCAPGQEEGTVFMWHFYERTMLNDIRSMLLDLEEIGTAPADSRELIAFIESLTGKGEGPSVGARTMVDLCEIATKCFFHPDTNGRSSIKVVLPAVMKSSALLKEIYSQPIYGAKNGIESKNFPLEGSEGMTWWVAEGDGAKNPYDLLPPIFADIPQALLEKDDEENGTDIREGGAATTAYARMQFTEVTDTLRDATRKALLRYCELDTLAMVMIYQAWTEWAKE